MNKGSLLEPLKGGLRKALVANLTDGEEPDVVIHAALGEAIALTNHRVLIVKAGFSGGALFGKKVNAYPYKTITGVEYSTGLTQGRVEITTAGTTQKGSGTLGDTYQAQNVVSFGKAKYAKMQKVANIIRERVATVATTEETRVPPAPSVADELSKLKQLLDDGVLSQEEFDAQKSRLLSR